MLTRSPTRCSRSARSEHRVFGYVPNKIGRYDVFWSIGIGQMSTNGISALNTFIVLLSDPEDAPIAGMQVLGEGTDRELALWKRPDTPDCELVDLCIEAAAGYADEFDKILDIYGESE